MALVVDALVGDPEWSPHPVRAIGAAIAHAERRLRAALPTTPRAELFGGAVLAATVTTAAWYAGDLVTRLERHRIGSVAVVAAAGSTLAARALVDEARQVLWALRAGDIPSARARTARIVGRDTADLDACELSRAVIETLAESLCDGIVAPLFYLVLLGLPGAFAFKAISTLDSMIGHRDDRYRFFGAVAARLDDAANLLPSRLAALSLTAAAALTGDDARGARAVRRRDARRHPSPNAGHPEAAMAGALRVRLGGRNVYDGEAHEMPTLCAEGAPPQPADVARAIRLTIAAIALAGSVATALCALLAAWNRDAPRR
jgi:adenosylcobinamide-phosphate synthase